MSWKKECANSGKKAKNGKSKSGVHNQRLDVAVCEGNVYRFRIYLAAGQRGCISSCFWHVWATDFFSSPYHKKFQRKCFVFPACWSRRSDRHLFTFFFSQFFIRGVWNNNIVVFCWVYRRNCSCVMERSRKKRTRYFWCNHHGCYFCSGLFVFIIRCSIIWWTSRSEFWDLADRRRIDWFRYDCPRIESF